MQLLAWAIGDFDYVEAMTQRKYQGKSIPVRVYTTKGLKEQARFALECAHRTVDYFSNVFKIEYPLPKADLLAVHEFVCDPLDFLLGTKLIVFFRPWVLWRTGALSLTAQLLSCLTRANLIPDTRTASRTLLLTVSFAPNYSFMLDGHSNFSGS